MKKKIIVFGGTFNPIHQAHLKIARFLLRKFKPDKILFIPCNIPYHKTCPVRKNYSNGSTDDKKKSLGNKLSNGVKKPTNLASACEEIIAPSHRMEMVRRAIKNEQRFDISDIEIKRGGKTFSVETMKALKRQYPVGTEFYFVIGTDSLIDLPRWYEIGKLIKLCKFITIARPGYPFPPEADMPQVHPPKAGKQGSGKKTASDNKLIRKLPSLDSARDKWLALSVAEGNGPSTPFGINEPVEPFSAPIIKSIKQLYQPNPRLDISSTQIRKNLREGKSIKSLVPAVVEDYIKEHKLIPPRRDNFCHKGTKTLRNQIPLP